MISSGDSTPRCGPNCKNVFEWIDLPPEKVDGLSYFSFHVSRAEEAVGGVEPVGVIEAFDVGEDISFCLISGVVDAVMNAFSFQSVEEAFYRRIDAPMSNR